MLLMTPGPIAVDQRVVAAMNRPAISHHSPEFYEVIDDVQVMLRRIFMTESPVAVCPGSGRVGLESAIVSVVEPGDRTLHVVNGTFSLWSSEIAQRAHAETTIIEGRYGGPIELDQVRQALRSQHYKLVTVCHCETSTGTLYDPRELASLCHQYDALLMLDAISSVGSMKMSLDDWDLDLVVGNSNKALGAIVGLSLVGIGPRAIEAMERRTTLCQSRGLDLKRWLASLITDIPRPIAVVPFTHLYFALQEACRQILAEGLQARWDRHRRYAEASRQAIEAVGLDLFPDRELASDSVSAIRVPPGIAEEAVVRTMRDRHNIIIAGSMPGLAKGKLFRLSHQGVQASKEYLAPTLIALEDTLNTLGHEVRPASGVEAFVRALH